MHKQTGLFFKMLFSVYVWFQWAEGAPAHFRCEKAKTHLAAHRLKIVSVRFDEEKRQGSAFWKTSRSAAASLIELWKWSWHTGNSGEPWLVKVEVRGLDVPLCSRAKFIFKEALKELFMSQSQNLHKNPLTPHTLCGFECAGYYQIRKCSEWEPKCFSDRV